MKNVSASRKPKGTPTGTTNSPNSTSTSVSPASATTTKAAATGSLPFTGLDIVALAAGGIVLLGAGVVLRRVSASDRT